MRKKAKIYWRGKQMNRISTQQDWFDRLLPEGLPIPSLTLLSGPGGSGKPLIGNVITASWLRQGGSVVFMSLQYPDHSSAGNRIKANVVKPAVWDAAIEQACQMVPDEGPGILIFASALNLLLFSPTYGKGVLEKMKAAARGNQKRTYLFSASTTAKAEEIAELEAAANKRIEGANFISEEIEVPFSADVLMDVKEVADHSRKRVIPQVSEL
jgi:hypothetical protein